MPAAAKTKIERHIELGPEMIKCFISSSSTEFDIIPDDRDCIVCINNVANIFLI